MPGPPPQRALIDELDAHFAAMSTAECEAPFVTADCCLALVLDLDQATQSDHMRRPGLVRRHPTIRIWEADYPVRVDGLRPEFRRPLVEEGDSPRSCDRSLSALPCLEDRLAGSFSVSAMADAPRNALDGHAIAGGTR